MIDSIKNRNNIAERFQEIKQNLGIQMANLYRSECIYELYSKGISSRKIAEKLGCSASTVRAVIKDMEERKKESTKKEKSIKIEISRKKELGRVLKEANLIEKEEEEER